MRINICSHCSYCKPAKSPEREYSHPDSTIAIPSDAANSMALYITGYAKQSSNDRPVECEEPPS